MSFLELICVYETRSCIGPAELALHTESFSGGEWVFGYLDPELVWDQVRGGG